MHKRIIQWACNELSSLGYILKSNVPEMVKDTPWSYVVRFETSEGYIYLKHTPELIALETDIIKILRDQFKASVPDVIANDLGLNCFLMKDAGRPLREILKQHFSAELLCKSIDQFTSLQIRTVENVNVFLDIGVPDWRLNKLPALFMDLLTQQELLLEDGLTEIELNELQMLSPKISDLCQKLSTYQIKPCIVQPDFNDNNTLIDELSKKITIIDLGEIVISHPFFSVANCLQHVKKHHGLSDQDEKYLKIKNACFKNFLIFGSEKQLSDAFETALILWNVYGAISVYRLMIACGKERLMAFQPGKLTRSLKELNKIFFQA